MIDRLEGEIEMVERHLDVLRTVIEEEPIGIVTLSDETGYPHHKVRYSLRILEEGGLIEPTAHGAVPTEAADEFIARHEERIDAVIDQLEGTKIGHALSSL